MRVGVITDSHDNKTAILRAIEIFNKASVDLVIHAGDMIAPFSALLFRDLRAPLKFHLGNNDGEILVLREKLIEIGAEFYKYDFVVDIEDRKVLVQHEPTNLEALAASGTYDAIIYGHTHDLDVREGRTLILNPGESCRWLRGLANVAILDTKTMKPEIIDLFKAP